MADIATLTDTGKQAFAAALAGVAPVPVYVGWGTGSGTPTASMTGLFGPAAEARTPGSKSVTDGTLTGDTFTVTGSVVAATGHTITEAGLFADLGGATLVEHLLLETPITVVAGESITFLFSTKCELGS